MAAWGYEFFLLVHAESISHSFALEHKIRIPASPCNILYFLRPTAVGIPSLRTIFQGLKL